MTIENEYVPTDYEVEQWLLDDDRCAREFVAQFEQFVIENAGPRCTSFESGCHCCELWRLYDLTRAQLLID